MTDETRGNSGGSQAQSPAKLPPRNLLKVAKDEVDAVMLVPVPPHPDVVFDDNELRTLLANTQTLTIVEKIKTIVSCGSFTKQHAVDTLLESLRGESEGIAQLNEKLNEGLEGVAHKRAAVETKPTTSDLTPGETAGIVSKAIPGLLTAIGAGEGQTFFTAFLQRLARQIEQGGTSVIEGELPAVFETEFRNSELNKNPDDPRSEVRLMETLVRPALSKLRHNLVSQMVEHKGSMFVIALVIEGPEKSRGRVKQRHRIGLFIRLDSRETVRVKRMHSMLRHVVGQVKARGQELIQLERLRPFGPIIRRVVEKTGYTTEKQRAENTFYVTAAVLGNILSALRNDQRLPFLVHLFEWPVRWSGAIPTANFDKWFLNAVDFNDGLWAGDENFDYRLGLFQTRLRDAPLLTFPTKLLLLNAYHLAPKGDRMFLVVLLGFLDEGRVSDVTDTDTTFRPPETVDLQDMLATNLSDVTDFLRIVEARAVDDFARE